MQPTIVIGEFRSLDTARLAIQKLHEHNFLDISLRQIGPAPGNSLDSMTNAYAGELPLFARGVPGSDVAVEGKTEALYSEEDAKEIMGGDVRAANAYAVVVRVRDESDRQLTKKILTMYGAETQYNKL